MSNSVKVGYRTFHKKGAITVDPSEVVRRWLENNAEKRSRLLCAARGCDGCSVCKPSESGCEPHDR